MIRPSHVLAAGLGALTYPITQEITYRLLGRKVLHPDYRKEK